MMADRGKRGDVEDWLRDAKTHLIGTSIPWKYLRSQIVAELTTRLLADQKIVLQQQHDQKQQPNNINSSIYNPLFGRPLNDWSLQERLELCEAVKESLNSLSPDLFAAAAEDIRDYVQGHFHLHVYKLLKLKSSSKMNASSKSQLDSKV